MPHAILMPKPGQMTEECTVIAWRKREGDHVAKGDVLFEIETDKSAIRTNNPVMFVESQGLYTAKGLVPEGEHLVPIGKANVVREGGDVTMVSWGPAVTDCLAAAERLAAEDGLAAEVVDLRSLVPLDIDTVLASVRKTGRCVVASQAVLSGSFVNEVVARIQGEVFDYLDAPVARIGAQNGISPQAEGLEKAFLPNAGDIYTAAKGLL